MRNPTVGFRGNDAGRGADQAWTAFLAWLHPPSAPCPPPPCTPNPGEAAFHRTGTVCEPPFSFHTMPRRSLFRPLPPHLAPAAAAQLPLSASPHHSHRQPPPRSAAQLPLSSSPMQQWPAIPPPPPPVPLPLARQPFGGPLGALYLRPGPPTALPSLPLSASQALPTAALPSAALPQGDDVDPMPCCCPPPINGPPTAGAGNRARPSG